MGKHLVPAMLVAAAVIAAGAAGIASAAAPPQDVVVGSGWATFPDFPNPGESVTEQFIVSAHSGPLGEDPHGQITFHSPLLASGHAKADVTCMTVTGNRARVGGVFSEPVIYIGLVFGWFELIVEDNGPPGHGTDRTTSFIFFDRPRPPDFSPCNFDGPTEFAVEQGNYTVTDAVPTG
jgi:hypothetical protein